MKPKQPNWVKQAKLDLLTLGNVLAEVGSLVERIETAIANLDSEAHSEAIVDWLGMEA